MQIKKLTAALTAILCSASTLAAFPALNASAVQAVFNDFEVTYGGWYAEGDATLTAQDGAGFGGTRGMTVTGRTTPDEGAASVKGFYLTGGVAYTYSVKVKADTDETFRLSVLTLDEETDAETVQEIAVKTAKAGEWTTITGKYTAPQDSYKFTLDLTTDSTADFSFDEVSVTSMEPQTLTVHAAEQGLKDVFAGYFRVGNILNGGTVRESSITARLLKDCNAIECENETKPEATLRAQGSTDTNVQVSLNSCAAIMDFCVENHLGFRGHTLVWHSQTPEWFFKEGFDANKNWVSKDVMDKRMESYIHNMFNAIQTQYPSLDLYAYDVCNECISDDPGRTANFGGAREPGMPYQDHPNSPWVQIYGDNSFVEKAFTFARQYAPESCDLYYNDYNEYWDHKRDCIYNMCKSLYQKGLLDGVGMQSHISAEAEGFTGVKAYTEAMKKYLSIGCDVQITELDVSVDNGKFTYTQQADKYEAIFRAAMDWNKNPESGGRVTLVQVWGPDDGHSWLKSGSNGLLYDAMGQPKEAYNRLLAMVPQSEWGQGVTPAAEPEVDADGYWMHVNFENGAGGFTGRGEASAEVTDKEHYEGSKSLYVSGRTASWNGASLNLNPRIFKAGETFSFSADVMYPSGAASDTFYLSLQYKGADGETHYDHIAQAAAAKGEWVQLLSTTYTLPAGGSDFVLYVEMPDSKSDFYVDDVIASVAGKVLPGAGASTSVSRTKATTGDVNGDGVIDVFDLSLAKRGIVKGFADPLDEQSADTDGSGKVEVTDLVLLTKYLHGLVTAFPEREVPDPVVDSSKWDSYQETADADAIRFYQSAIKNMGNTYRLVQKLSAAEQGAPLTVAYLGGSITEGRNYTTPFSNYLKETFAKGGFTEVNAGMSGTSSVVGLVRSEKDIVAANPDIIFLEFSVNDHEDILYKKAFESCIQKFLNLPNAPAVGIIINRSRGGFSMQSQMAPIGENFDIPVISMDDALTGAFNSGYLKTEDYFTDEYHPHQKGGQLVADCLAYYVRQAMKSENQSSGYTLPASAVYGNELASCVNVDPATLDNFNAGSWTAGKGYGSLPFGYTLNGGSPMTFKTTGKGLVIVFCAKGEGMGSIDVTVNGKTTHINGNKLYTWGGPDAELGYYQDTEGELDVSITGTGPFTIWGVGLVK